MTPVEPPNQNAEQVRFWNEIGAPRWIAFQRALDGQLGPLGERTMDRAAIASGERVLDVGCGCGTTTLALAGRVGPAGSVVGVDVAAPMLEVGWEAARRAGVLNVRLEHADAQEHAFPPGAFDVVYSRFGVMFFTDPVAAFANLRSALGRDGRLAFVCWQAAEENPWVVLPMQAAAPHVPFPRPAGPDAPGPFSFADPDRVRRILDRAGFAAVEIEALREMISFGGPAAGLDDVVELALHLGPVGAALREADPALRPRVAAAIREAVAPLVTERGLEMGSAAWIVTGS